MNEKPSNDDHAFEAVAQEGRIGRTARMLKESDRLKPNQRTDIIDRFFRFIEQPEHNYTQAAVGRQIGASSTTISEVLRQRYTGDKADTWLVKINNWLELTARRHGIVRSREFVTHSVARDILTAAGVVAETCMIGVVFGPARIGKTFTLKAIEGDQAFGDPVLITIDESTVRPFALCRRTCGHFNVPTGGTFDRVFARLVTRLTDTKRMLMFDEADLVSYPALEWIRQLHDQTGCPILLAGKPKIYEHLGFRELGGFSEQLDQLGGRITVKRDLTERTRGENPQPLYTLDDVRKMIRQSGLLLKVSRDAEKWLQDHVAHPPPGAILMTRLPQPKVVSSPAEGDWATIAKVAYAQGDPAITADHLEAVDELTMGHEDAARVAEMVADSSGMKRVV